MKPVPLPRVTSLVRRQRQRLLSYSRPLSAAVASSSLSSLPDSHNTPLHQLFDIPLASYTPTTHHSSTSPSGLFLQPSLTNPRGFPEIAHRTTQRAKVLVQRISTPRTAPTSIEDTEKQFLDMVKALDRLSDLLCGVIDLAELIRNVHPVREWSEGANQAYEGLCGYMNELNTHVGLYQGLKALHSILPPTTPQKSPELFAAYAVATPFLRDFEKSGIHLPSTQRNRFVDLSSEILQLGRRFLQNAAEPRPAVWVRLEEVAQAFGEPFARRLFGDGVEGGEIDPGSWEGRVLARQHPSSDLRKRLYLGANTAPDRSHVEVLDTLLRRRGELARLVGRESWGEVALEDKMAQAPSNVMSFLNALNAHNQPLAQRDLASLRQTKRTYGRGQDSTTIEAWDRDYFSDLSNDRPSGLPDLSPFFSVGSCFVGLSSLFERLYGIRFEPEQVVEGEVWEPSVRKLKVIDEDEGRIGTIYCDLFAREGKQAGAAHYTVRCSRRIDDDDAEADFGAREYVEVDGGERVYKGDDKGLLEVPEVEWRGREGRFQEPIVVLVCGFGQEGEWETGRTCLQWHEVETLFHEMGHAIHSMIGRTSYHNVSGTRCATDFVELPSILMEHFISSPSVLDLFALHPSTSRPIPRSILNDLLLDRQRFSALETSSQIMMASLDQSYHTSAVLDPSFSSTEELRRINNRFHVIAHPKEPTEWQLTFGHLFGYGATYYSYLFDRAIAARLFSSKFADDPLSREKGEELKKGLLRWGGGKEPWQMVGEVVGDESVMVGGEEAMTQVGRWGIEEAKQGK